jgi:hypothetical protein
MEVLPQDCFWACLRKRSSLDLKAPRLLVVATLYEDPYESGRPFSHEVRPLAKDPNPFHKRRGAHSPKNRKEKEAVGGQGISCERHPKHVAPSGATTATSPNASFFLSVPTPTGTPLGMQFSKTCRNQGQARSKEANARSARRNAPAFPSSPTPNSPKGTFPVSCTQGPRPTRSCSQPVSGKSPT